MPPQWKVAPKNAAVRLVTKTIVVQLRVHWSDIIIRTEISQRNLLISQKYFVYFRKRWVLWCTQRILWDVRTFRNIPPKTIFSQARWMARTKWICSPSMAVRRTWLAHLAQTSMWEIQNCVAIYFEFIYSLLTRVAFSCAEPPQKSKSEDPWTNNIMWIHLYHLDVFKSVKMVILVKLLRVIKMVRG